MEVVVETMRAELDRVVGVTTVRYNEKENIPETLGNSYIGLDPNSLVIFNKPFNCDIDFDAALFDLALYVDGDALAIKITPRHILEFGNVETQVEHYFEISREGATFLLKSIEAFLAISDRFNIRKQ